MKTYTKQEVDAIVEEADFYYEQLKERICQIILEGEPTEIGMEITIDRIKDIIDYREWLNE